MRRWLGSDFTGCRFAQSFANQDALLFAVPEGIVAAEDIDSIFELAAAEHYPAVVVFPSIRDERGLLIQLERLAAGERWEVDETTVRDLDTMDALIRVRWRTADKLMSTPMGFAPFGTMPVTRRAPYVCLATWPGGHENPFRKKVDATSVDFLDAPPPGTLSDLQYKEVRKLSTERTGELLADLGDKAEHYRTVTYRLGSEYRWSPRT